MHAAIRESQFRSCHQLLDRARDQHLAGASEGGDSRSDVNGDATHVVAHRLALARVYARAKLNPQSRGIVHRLTGALDRTRGAIKQERAVADRLHETSV